MTSKSQSDDRKKVILNFHPENLADIDRWREVNMVESTTRTSMFKRAFEVFMWLWEAKQAGAKIMIEHPDGTIERVTRL